MSKAPDTIYITWLDPEKTIVLDYRWRTSPLLDTDQSYVRGDISIAFASQVGRLTAECDSWQKQAEIQAVSLRESNAEVERLRCTLKHIARNATVLTAHQIESMAANALENKP